MKKIEIYFRKLLLKLLLLVKSPVRSEDVPVFTRGSRILFIRLNRIGDALVSTPLLREIKEYFKCHITVLASKSNYFVFNDPMIADEIFVHNKRLQKTSALLRLINSYKFDAIVDLHDDVSTTVSYLMAFSNSKYKFGFSKSTEKLYTHTVTRPDASENHVIERVMAITKLFNFTPDTKEYNIYYQPRPESEQIAASFISKHFSEKKFLVGINISAGSEARAWEVKNYRQLLERFSLYDVNIIILCTPDDVNSAMNISNGKYPIFYRPDFNEFAAMIKELDFLFTPDTSVVHLASAYRKPVFGLYVKYNTSDLIWSPYKSEFECVITEEPDLKNVDYGQVQEKFFPFFEKCYNEQKNTKL